MLRANHPPGYNTSVSVPSRNLAVCVLRRVRPQLTPEEDFGNKLKRWIKL